ncbi:MAG: ATP-binding domain-containing protein [Burkholderiaceae bacterium]
MAQIHPSGWRELAVTGAAAREIETLAMLDAALADAPYRIYHGVHWTKIEKGFSAYGEIDFIVVAPDGRVLLIEQKAGFLIETADGLVKTVRNKPTRVALQILRTIDALKARFGDHGDALAIDYLLYCPDYHVKNPQLAGIAPERILDAGARISLATAIRRLLPLSEETPQLARVTRFFGDVLELSPDPGAMIGNAVTLVTRIAGGLATWARRLEFEPYRLRVVGTAGSGKTQLALAEYRAALDAGRRPLYVCYNRPLADHIRRLMPEGGRVASFHLLCDAFVRAQGATPDYGAPTVWADMERALATAPLPPEWKYDVLIVDEGQDFSQAWCDALLRLLNDGGRALWMEDRMQDLYGRDAVALPGWVTLHAPSNYRSPRRIVERLAAIGAAGDVEPMSPFAGADIEVLAYPEGDTAALYNQTKQAIRACLAAGFRRQDIALISYHGREKSALLTLDALGAHTLKSFTGDYDLFGNPIFREGDLLAESVYRFKGQSAPAVIFSEIDFEQLDQRALRKLFVGMTRARLKLVLVAAERAAALLRQE